jgi:hypothetical protein
MITKRIARTTIIFVTLTIAGICLIALPQSAADAAVRTVLPLIGAALFSSGLTYFMLEITRIVEPK